MIKYRVMETTSIGRTFGNVHLASNTAKTLCGVPMNSMQILTSDYRRGGSCKACLIEMVRNQGMNDDKEREDCCL